METLRCMKFRDRCTEIAADISPGTALGTCQASEPGVLTPTQSPQVSAAPAQSCHAPITLSSDGPSDRAIVPDHQSRSAARSPHPEQPVSASRPQCRQTAPSSTLPNFGFNSNCATHLGVATHPMPMGPRAWSRKRLGSFIRLRAQHAGHAA